MTKLVTSGCTGQISAVTFCAKTRTKTAINNLLGEPGVTFLMEQLVDYTAIIVALVSGLGAGTVGSLIAPWVNWGIDKRRLRIEARRRLLTNARSYIVSSSFGVNQVTSTSLYPQLKSEFSKEFSEEMEEAIEFTNAQNNVAFVREETRKSMLEEISRIEKKWKLI